MKKVERLSTNQNEVPTSIEEGFASIQVLMQELAEIEYQYFLEKNERLNAASDQPTLEISQNTNPKTAA